jgi:hypothetical protein
MIMIMLLPTNSNAPPKSKENKIHRKAEAQPSQANRCENSQTLRAP